mgnify:CR=1 FL=1
MKRHLVEALEDNARMLQKAKDDHLASMTTKGKAMLHLPDSNIKLIIPNELVPQLVDNCQFVMSEDSTEQNATTVLTPFDGQLNVTYFTGE